jgi:hypothetical protein
MNKTLNALKRAAATTRALDEGSAADLRNVVEEVGRFHEREGYAPSLTEIAKALGVTLVTARTSVLSLVESGHLAMKPGVGHSLRVASDADRLRARASAWYAALRDLPAIEVQAARTALDKLSNANGTTGAA